MSDYTDSPNECVFHRSHETRMDKQDIRFEKIEDKLDEIKSGLAVLQADFVSYSHNNIKEITNLNTCLQQIKADMKRLEIKSAISSVKQGGWGVLGGMVPVGIAVIIWFLQSGA